MSRPEILDVDSIDVVHDGAFMITKVPKQKHKVPPYNCFGAKYVGVIIGGLSKPASEMFSLLVQQRNLNTNEAQYIAYGVNDKCKLTRAYNELKEKDLVKRVKQQWYLINPAAVFPYFEEYKHILKKWDDL